SGCWCSSPWARCWPPATVAAIFGRGAKAKSAHVTAIRRGSSRIRRRIGTAPMNRTGLLLALALAAAVGLLFGVYPKLYLDLDRPFFDPAVGGFIPVLNGLRDVARL